MKHEFKLEDKLEYYSYILCTKLKHNYIIVSGFDMQVHLSRSEMKEESVRSMMQTPKRYRLLKRA